MANTSSNSSAISLGFLEFLTLIFITLKLTGYIGWSWWWVLSPLWVQVILFVFALVIVIAFAAKRKPTLEQKLRSYSDELERRK